MADACYVVDGGLKLIVDNLVADSIYKYVAWGIGATGAAATDTGMESILAR